MYDRILVPVDGSATCEHGLQEAIALAARLKATLVLLHVVDDFPFMVELASAASFDETRSRLLKMGNEILAQASRHATEGGAASETVLREVTSRRAADAIVEEATRRQCGLIVMGTHGRRGFNRLAMGSDAELVLRESPVPVLLVRHQD
ncbi:universal stress protein [Ideonella sp. YS5]|uniref:universal stress protein n=1 Tax=Ideonella sp. YS5 TaxID=3453714 RepID=UPI003EEE51DD